jgi:hypothetical protein
MGRSRKPILPFLLRLFSDDEDQMGGHSWLPFHFCLQG